MKNKGFSLVELIAVIVILSILISVTSSIFINVRMSTLKKQRENLIDYLEIKASEYAEDTGELIIVVETLIKEGYVNPDDDVNIYDPVDNSILNCYQIITKYENNEYVSNFTEKKVDKVNGVCKITEDDSNYEICSKESDTCNSILDSWYNKDLILGIKNSDGKLITEKDKYEITWKSSTGVFEVSDNLFINVSNDTFVAYYSVVIKHENSIKEVSKKIKIDLEGPIVKDVNIEKENEWTENGKNVTIIGDDHNGSGVKWIYISDEKIDNCNNLNYSIVVSNNKYKTKLSGGSHYVCLKDNAYNVSLKPFEIEIKNIDTTPTNPVITASDGLASGSYHEKDYTLSWKSTNVGSQDLIYYYGSSSSNLDKTGNSMNASKSDYQKYVYVKACTRQSNLCSGISKYLINKDSKPPVITLTSQVLSSSSLKNDACPKNYTLKATITDNESGIVAYAIDVSSSPKNWVNINTTKEFEVSRYIDWFENRGYYIFAKDTAGNVTRKYVYVCTDRAVPIVIDSYYSYDCSLREEYATSAYPKIIFANNNYSMYILETRVNVKPSINDYKWENTEYPVRKTMLQKTGEVYEWIKACNKYNECHVVSIGHAVCKNGRNPEGILYTSDISYCLDGYKYYDSKTDTYKCAKITYALDNIKDKNMGAVCPQGRVLANGTSYCCPSSDYKIKTDIKIGNYNACYKEYDDPVCSSGKRLSSNKGYCL